MLTFVLATGFVLVLTILYFIIGFICAGCYWAWNIVNNETLAKYFYYGDKEDIRTTLDRLFVNYNISSSITEEIGFYQTLLDEYSRVKEKSKSLLFFWWFKLFAYIWRILKRIVGKAERKTFAPIRKILFKSLSKYASKKYKDKWVEERLTGKKNNEER